MITRIPISNSDQHLLIDEADVPLLQGRSVGLTSHGYVRVMRQYVHRLVTRAGAGVSVDHINGNKLDCTRANLRLVNRSQNLANRGPAVHNKSGFKGVYLCKRTGRFRAEVRFENKRYKLGRFDTALEAARAYDAAAKQLHGEYARLNFTDSRDKGAIGRGCD